MFTPGNAFACIVNSHRGLWNGTICREASRWNCGAQETFREDFCANLEPKCFHIHLFSERGPRFESSEDSMADFLGSNPDRLVDQILVFYARRASEPIGIVTDAKFVAAGAYRVKSVALRQPVSGGREAWVIEPYEDGWVRFPFPKVAMPNATSLGMKYVRELRRNLLQDLFRDSVGGLDAKSLPASFELADLQRLRNFDQNLKGWLQIAEEKAHAFSGDMRPRSFTTRGSGGPANTLLAERLGRLKDSIRTVGEVASEEEAADASAAAGPTPGSVVAPSCPPVEDSAGAVAPIESVEAVSAEPLEAEPAVATVRIATEPIRIPEAALVGDLAGQFGDEVIQQLQVAFATKPIVVLAGPPGMGKSWLATHLLNDEGNERSIVVSVGSTWRGREDFLGYVNPVSSEFEPTAFTGFLIEAERAWRNGDCRPRLAILEEFNLSQPEHWLSDFLVASQFPADQEALRTIPLGGNGMRGDSTRHSVYLPPAVRIVATVNNDHTTRPLSPRVLDRAAVVEVRSAVKSIVQLVRLPLDDDQLAALEQADAILSGSGAGFSVRTALSIREASMLVGRSEGEAGMPWRCIDLVLLQEMLSKVRLLAGEPRDAKLLDELGEWAAGPYGSRLSACGSRIADWRSRYEAGDDISLV